MRTHLERVTSDIVLHDVDPRVSECTLIKDRGVLGSIDDGGCCSACGLMLP